MRIELDAVEDLKNIAHSSTNIEEIEAKMFDW